ncbi:MAG: hypothetical protein MZW92_10670 [Comamonadaceae bacterium]|nr:hypothetical protein [Comamonadaceae bacterium]
MIQAENQRASTLALAVAGAIVNLGEAAAVDAAAIAAAFAALAAAPGRVRASVGSRTGADDGDGPARLTRCSAQAHVVRGRRSAAAVRRPRRRR